MEHLLALPSCALFTTGRTGTDFLQSLLDSHPEVLTFNGHLHFHAFWENSICVGAGSFAAADLLDEFIGKNIEYLKSRYDLLERKHQLGEAYDQSIDIDLHVFHQEALRLLDGREINSKTALLAVYGAYALCLGQDLERKKVLFHHPHNFEELAPYMEDFPDSKVICMTRDPRANFVSGIEHHRDNNHVVNTDNGGHLYFYIKRILEDATALEAHVNDYMVIRIEDLGRKEILESLCGWLGIPYDECMSQSTWAGLRWHGDKLSKINRNEGFSSRLLENRWERRLSSTDKYVLNYIMYPRLKHYEYEYKKVGIFGTLALPFLILLPLSYEKRFWSPRYIGFNFKNNKKVLLRNGLNYFRRVKLFFNYYLKVTMQKKFVQPLLMVNPQISASARLTEE